MPLASEGAEEGGAGEGGAAPALMAARLGGVGQLGRRVDAAADALEPLPAGSCARFGCGVAHVVAGGHFTLVWPAKAAPWGSPEVHVEGTRRHSPLLYAASGLSRVPEGFSEG